MKLERIVLYNRVRPHACRQVFLGDKLTGRLNQNLDDFECAPPDRDGHSMRSQFAPSEIDLPLVQHIHRSSTFWAHVAVPVQDISQFIRFWQRTGKLWPTVRRTPLRSVAGRRLSISYFATRTLRSPTAVGKDPHLLRKTQNCCKELLRVRIEEATWED